MLSLFTTVFLYRSLCRAWVRSLSLLITLDPLRKSMKMPGMSVPICLQKRTIMIEYHKVANKCLINWVLNVFYSTQAECQKEVSSKDDCSILSLQCSFSLISNSWKFSLIDRSTARASMLRAYFLDIRSRSLTKV